MKWTEQDLADYLARRGVPGKPNTADTSAPPFLPPPPTEIVLDLPPPVSVNRIWRKTKTGVIKSGVYQGWIRRADKMLVELGQIRGSKQIVGKFTTLIILKRSNMDIDNGAKCILDFLQSRCFIVNDNLCEELTLRWGEAPTGARVTVRPVKTVNDVLRAAAERMECA